MSLRRGGSMRALLPLLAMVLSLIGTVLPTEGLVAPAPLRVPVSSTSVRSSWSTPSYRQHRMAPATTMAASRAILPKNRYIRVYPISLGTVVDSTTDEPEESIILSTARSVSALGLIGRGSDGRPQGVGDMVLAVPATSPRGAYDMLERAVRGTPMSKVEFLRMAPALVNRDGGIYDELPWKEWTVGDPFFSKRDCFERFIGRDYPGQSLKVR